MSDQEKSMHRILEIARSLVVKHDESSHATDSTQVDVETSFSDPILILAARAVLFFAKDPLNKNVINSSEPLENNKKVPIAIRDYIKLINFAIDHPQAKLQIDTTTVHALPAYIRMTIENLTRPPVKPAKINEPKSEKEDEKTTANKSAVKQNYKAKEKTKANAIAPLWPEEQLGEPTRGQKFNIEAKSIKGLNAKKIRVNLPGGIYRCVKLDEGMVVLKLESTGDKFSFSYDTPNYQSKMDLSPHRTPTLPVQLEDGVRRTRSRKFL